MISNWNASINISVREYNKISKYKIFEIEIEKTWYFKTTTVSVIVGALRMIKKGTDKNVSSPSLNEILKNCALRTCSSPKECDINLTENYYSKVAAKTWIHRQHIITTFPYPRFQVKTVKDFKKLKVNQKIR